MGWIEWDKRAVPGQPEIGLGKAGSAGFSGAARALLGGPERVVVAFDPDRRLVGFRAARAADARTLLMSKHGKGAGGSVYVRAFLTYWGIRHGELARFVARLEGEWLVCGPVTVDKPAAAVVAAITRQAAHAAVRSAPGGWANPDAERAARLAGSNGR